MELGASMELLPRPPPIRIPQHADRQREENVMAAKFAQLFDRGEDMVSAMKRVAQCSHLRQLNEEERDLLYRAYDDQIASRLRQWRTICRIQRNEALEGGDEVHVAAAAELRAKIESEMRDICQSFLGLVDGHVLRKARAGEAQIFWWRAKADFQRHLAEFDSSSDEYESLAQCSLERAHELALEHLRPSSRQSLQLIVDLYLFYEDAIGCHDKAFALARESVDLIADDIQQDLSRGLPMLEDSERQNLIRFLQLQLATEEHDGDSDEVIHVR
ncbi:hypothetical protein MPTK2_8g18260 [Marchantia polymorpha subsp. ruderalis]